MNNTWIIYVHVVPKEITNYGFDKYYIGITSQTFECRCKNGNGYKQCTHFWNAIKKYGWDNIQHIILKDNLTEYEAKEMEKILINYFQSNNSTYGYNLTMGGDGTLGLSHSVESKNKISKAKKGKKYSPEVLNSFKLKRREKSKNVFQFDKLGNFVREFDSVAQASEITGYKAKGIANCCNNESPTYKNYIWKYKNDLTEIELYNLSIQPYKKKINIDSLKKIIQLDLNGNIVNTFLSGEEARKYIGVKSSNKIYEAALEYNRNHKLVNRYGYLWIYEEDFNQNSEIKYNSSFGKLVKQYDLYFNYIQTFSSVKQAERELGIKNIKNVLSIKCKEYRHSAGGFYWVYV